MENILASLRQKTKTQGYITFDEILETADRFDLDLVSIDNVVDQLLDEKVIILEDEPFQATSAEVFDSEYDKSQLDYDEIFDEVIAIAPQLITYINTIKNIPAPQLGEEHSLIVLAQDDNPYARERLVNMFLKVVVRIALAYHKLYGSSLEDTIQEGNIGLIISIGKFTPAPDRRFSGYAPWWVQQNIQRELDGPWLNVYTPAYVKNELFQIIRFVGLQNLQETNGDILNSTTVSEIVNGTSLDKKKVEKYLGYFLKPCRIEDMSNFSKEEFWERRLENDILSKLYFEPFLASLESEDLNHGLSERDKRIIKLRLGLTGEESQTYQEIGDELGLSRERIRQILNQILGKPFIKTMIKDLYSS